MDGSSTTTTITNTTWSEWRISTFRFHSATKMIHESTTGIPLLAVIAEAPIRAAFGWTTGIGTEWSARRRRRRQVSINEPTLVCPMWVIGVALALAPTGRSTRWAITTTDANRLRAWVVSLVSARKTTPAVQGIELSVERRRRRRQRRHPPLSHPRHLHPAVALCQSSLLLLRHQLSPQLRGTIRLRVRAMNRFPHLVHLQSRWR